MLTIRLHRIGKTNRPSFKMVVVDKRISAAAGKFREEVGSVNRIAKQINLNKERIIYWISKGAQPSPSVNNILVSQKVIEGKKIANHAQPKRPAAEVAPASGGKPQGVAVAAK
jgi:small subunit ribosomal protein S16